MKDTANNYSPIPQKDECSEESSNDDFNRVGWTDCDPEQDEDGPRNEGQPQQQEDQTSEKSKSTGSDRALRKNSDPGQETNKAIGDAVCPVVTYGPYEVDSKGVFFVTSNGEGKSKRLRLCSPLKVVAFTRDETNNNWGVCLEFQDRDHKTHRWVMPQQMLNSSEFINQLLSMGLDVSALRNVRELLAGYITAFRTDARALCVDRLGWSNGCFVLPDRTIGSSGEDSVVFQSVSVR